MRKNSTSETREATGGSTQPLCFVFGGNFLARNVEEYISQNVGESQQEEKNKSKNKSGLWPNHVRNAQ